MSKVVNEAKIKKAIIAKNIPQTNTQKRLDFILFSLFIYLIIA